MPPPLKIRSNQVVITKYSVSLKPLTFNEIRFRGRGPKRSIRSKINLDVNKRNLFQILNSLVNLSLNPKGRKKGVFVFALKLGKRDRLIGLGSNLRIK